MNSEPLVEPQVQPIPEPTAAVNEPLLPEKPQEESDAKASVGASIVNMTNNVLGSGLVALAYSISRVWIILFIITLVLACSWNSSPGHLGCHCLSLADYHHQKLQNHRKVHLQGNWNCKSVRRAIHE